MRRCWLAGTSACSRHSTSLVLGPSVHGYRKTQSTTTDCSDAQSGRPSSSRRSTIPLPEGSPRMLRLDLLGSAALTRNDHQCGDGTMGRNRLLEGRAWPGHQQHHSMAGIQKVGGRPRRCRSQLSTPRRRSSARPRSHYRRLGDAAATSRARDRSRLHRGLGARNLPIIDTGELEPVALALGVKHARRDATIGPSVAHALRRLERRGLLSLIKTADASHRVSYRTTVATGHIRRRRRLRRFS